VVDQADERRGCLEPKLASKASFARHYFETENLKLLALATHDLRNPIAGILAASQYLLDEAPPILTDEQLQLINSIRSSSQLLLRLVDNILDVSNIESGTVELDCRPTDLLALIHQNLVANRLLGLSKGIRINLVAEDCLPEISIDALRMSEVIDNLVTNAIKFSDAGGEIEIRVARRRNMTAISVRDQGPGMSAEQVQSLCRPFKKGSSSHYVEGRGNGLGLAIARRIVNRHGGRIEIESSVGSGSTFTVLLPISRRTGIRQRKRLLHQTAGGASSAAI
jgi:signal transduction histidine kinase